MAILSSFRVYTISLPTELAQKAEELAQRDSRSINELFSKALDAYYAQSIRNNLLTIGEYAAGRNPGYTEDDVPRLIAETRADVASPDTRK